MTSWIQQLMNQDSPRGQGRVLTGNKRCDEECCANPLVSNQVITYIRRSADLETCATEEEDFALFIGHCVGEKQVG